MAKNNQTYSVKRQHRGVEVIYNHLPKIPGASKDYREKFLFEGEYKALVDRILVEQAELYQGSWEKNEIELVKVFQIVADRHWLEVYSDVLFGPMPGEHGPQPGIFKDIRHTDSGIYDTGALCVVLSPKQELILIRQFRHTERRVTTSGEQRSLEVPRSLRKGKESITQCAVRTAAQNLGIDPEQLANPFYLGEHNPNNGVSMQQDKVFGFTDVLVSHDFVKRFEKTKSDITIEKYTMAEAKSLIASGAITCGQTKAALLQAHAMDFISI